MSQYKLRYRIRDWFFRLLFPSIARHMAHLIDDVIELETKRKQPDIKLNILSTSMDTTEYHDG